jgi:hypothetical protein
MSKTLTEASSFDASVVVPEGGDSRATAAESVEALAQSLANRTRYLYDNLATAGSAASLGATQTFTGINTFTDAINAEVTANDVPLLVTHQMALSFKWKLLFTFKLGGGNYVNQYAGFDYTGLGSYISTVNATWNPTTLRWHQITNTAPSVAIIQTAYGFRSAWRAAGAADWLDWLDDYVDVPIADALAVIDGIAWLAPDVSWPSGAPTTLLSYTVVGGVWGSTSTSRGGTLVFPLRMPHGSRLDKLTVVHQQPSGTSRNEYTIVRNYTDGSGSLHQDTLGSSRQSDSRDGVNSFDIDAGSTMINSGAVYLQAMLLSEGGQIRSLRAYYR